MGRSARGRRRFQQRSSRGRGDATTRRRRWGGAVRSSCGRELRRRMMSVVRGVFQRWRSPRGIASTQGSTSPRPQVRWLLVGGPPWFRFQTALSMSQSLHFGARRPHGDEDDDLAAERESDARRVWRSRGHGARWRGGGEAGHEAEESPSHEGAVRARGEVSVEMQGVQRLSARS